MSDLAGFSDEEDWTGDVLSLVLFVHLAIASDADKALAAHQLHRTHHRILFLVSHRPGITVGEIVNLLRVSAQAIQAPLRTLISDGLIQQQSSERDRRRRHLIITDQGSEFLEILSRAQLKRISDSRRRAGDESFGGYMRVMRTMMDEGDRKWLFPPKSEGRSRRAKPFVALP